MVQELTRSLRQRPTKAHVLWELAGCISSAVGAERYRLYLAERGDPEIFVLLYYIMGPPSYMRSIVIWRIPLCIFEMPALYSRLFPRFKISNDRRIVQNVRRKAPPNHVTMCVVTFRLLVLYLFRQTHLTTVK